MFFITTADPSLQGNIGRFEINSLSQQTLMELLVADMAYAALCNAPDFIDKCEWPGITCDADASVIRIHLTMSGGTVNLQGVPSTVKKLEMRSCDLFGTFASAALPRGLTYCALSSNSLTGSISIEYLPQELIAIFLSYNQLSGSINLRAAPPQLKLISFDANRLSGSLDLTGLPPCLSVLGLGENSFTGEVDISNLPVGMRELRIQKNSLSGVLDIQAAKARNPSLHVNCDGNTFDAILR